MRLFVESFVWQCVCTELSVAEAYFVSTESLASPVAQPLQAIARFRIDAKVIEHDDTAVTPNAFGQQNKAFKHMNASISKCILTGLIGTIEWHRNYSNL